jgi:hypothetical protein
MVRKLAVAVRGDWNGGLGELGVWEDWSEWLRELAVNGGQWEWEIEGRWRED